MSSRTTFSWGDAPRSEQHFCHGGPCVRAGVVGTDSRATGWWMSSKGAVSTQADHRESDRPTTLKTRIVAHSQQVVRFDRESRRAAARKASSGFFPTSGPPEGAGSRRHFRLQQRGSDKDALDESARRWPEQSGCLRGSQTERFWSLSRIDVITPNHHEMARALGIEYTRGRSLRHGHFPAGRYGFQALLVTRGEEGMSLFDGTTGSATRFFPRRPRKSSM